MDTDPPPGVPGGDVTVLSPARPEGVQGQEVNLFSLPSRTPPRGRAGRKSSSKFKIDNIKLNTPFAY